MSTPPAHTAQNLALQEAEVAQIRADFPLLHREVHGHPLVYLDNGATAQKPQAVINRMQAYYALENSNIHRGVHYLSQEATNFYEEARETVQTFLHAPHAHEVIFTRGTTEAINVVAFSFGERYVQAGDEIIVSAMEHHSNLVPWHMLCERKGATLRIIPVNDRGELVLDDLPNLFTARTKLVALVHVSNTLGTINPVEEITEMAHAHGVPVLLDGAQTVPHMPVDVQALGCDFFCFSGHKMFGPTGVGILWGKEQYLNELPPYQGGGSMIETVTLTGTTYHDLPHKFEAGTPNIAAGLGLAAAMQYLMDIGMDRIAAYEHHLLEYATETLNELEGLRMIGEAQEKAAVCSFLLGDIHPFDTGTLLDQMGIATRTGHHCTMPLMTQFGIPGTVRASLAFYNTREEIDRLVEGLRHIQTLFG